MTGKDQPGWQRPTAVEAAVFFNELLLLAVLALAGARLGGDVALRDRDPAGHGSQASHD